MSDTEFHVDSRETLQNAPTAARGDQATDISTAIQMLTAILAQQQQQIDAAAPPQPTAVPATTQHPTPLTPAVRHRVPWNLLKTLVPDKLDIDNCTTEQHKSWKRGFQQFASDADLLSCPWSDQYMAFEKSTLLSTFTKIDARRLQLPTDQQQQLNTVIALTDSMVERSKSIWVSRHEFHLLNQKPHQPIRNFYSEVIELSSSCEFETGFCDHCKQLAVDLQVLSKLVFSTCHEEARRELLRQDNLTVTKATEILESEERLQAVENVLQTKTAVNQISTRPKQGPPRRRNDHTKPKQTWQRPTSNKTECGKCGLIHKGPKCPAEGDTCHSCGGKNHWSVVCRNKRKQMSPKQPSNKSHNGKQMASLICEIGTQVDYAVIQLIGESGCATLQAAVDTGSDWCCMTPDNIHKISENPYNLCPPTPEMMATKSASGDYMKPVGYFNAQIKFGAEAVKTPVVVFENLHEPHIILAKEVLQDLGIVSIRLTPPVPPRNNRPQTSTINQVSIETAPDDTPSGHDALTMQSIVIDRMDSTPVVSEIHIMDKRHLMSKYGQVFAPRESPMVGEKFEISLVPNAVPCRITRCRDVCENQLPALKRELERLQAEKITVQTKKTDWVNPIVIQPKKRH